MKYFLSIVLILVTAFAKAQIVNIPDLSFKTLLLNYTPAIDTNHDGEIQVTEALAVHKLNVMDAIDLYIGSTEGLTAFKNLDTIFYNTSLPSLDLSGLNKLRFLDIQDAGYTSGLDLHVLNLSGCSALESLNTQNSSLTGLNLTGCTSLKSAYFYDLNIPNFNPGSLDSLKSITLEGTNQGSSYFNNVDFSGCRNLERFETNTARFQNINLSGLKELRVCNLSCCDENYILANVNLSGCEKLRRLSIVSSYMTSLNLSGCKALSNLFLVIADVTSLDLSDCINMDTLLLGNSGVESKLRYLNLKNGRGMTSVSLGLGDSTWVCADDFEIDYVLANINTFLPNVPNPFVFVSSTCSGFPGGNYNIIKGTVRTDYNNNGCDGNDPFATSFPVKLTDTANRSYISYTNVQGDYVHNVYKGVFNVEPYLTNTYFNATPVSASMNFDTANSLTAINDFCLTPNGTSNDLEISFLSTWPPARPGFSPGYALVYRNKGTTTLSGNVQLNYNPTKLTFTLASPVASSQTAGQLTWNYSNLQPFETRSINVIFHLSPPPTNNNNEIILYQAAITPSVNDITPVDNSVVLSQRIQGAFDPNDKQCLQGDSLDISAINRPLDYVIHFQNLGTDTAFNIVVADTLSNKFDWNSFEFTGSSHPCSVTRKDNKLAFVFNNIQLPYKSINEPASNGFVAYKIKPISTVVLGDSLNNKASIYFDFNLPVVTNLATTIISNVSTPVAIKLDYFNATTNGSKNILNWKASCTSEAPSFSIERSTDGYHFVAIGNIVTNTDRCRLPYQFTDNNPPAGKNYYRIKMLDVDGVITYSKIVLLSSNKSGVTITAVAGNSMYFNSDKAQKINIRLIAADGKLMYSNSGNLLEGNGEISLPLNNLASGVYTLMLVSDDGIVTRKFVK